jgi:hypothetical protein
MESRSAERAPRVAMLSRATDPTSGRNREAQALSCLVLFRTGPGAPHHVVSRGSDPAYHAPEGDLQCAGPQPVEAGELGGALRGGVRGRPSARGAVSVSINPLCPWTRSLASECVTGPVVRIWFFDRYTSISYICRRISPISRPRREGLEGMAATVASLCCNSGPSGRATR